MAGLSDQDESVKQRAVDNIMKLINSQLALEKKQAKMDAKVRCSRLSGRRDISCVCHLVQHMLSCSAKIHHLDV